LIKYKRWVLHTVKPKVKNVFQLLLCMMGSLCLLFLTILQVGLLMVAHPSYSLIPFFAPDLNGTLSIRLRNNYSSNRYGVSWERLGHRFNQNAPTCPLTLMPSGWSHSPLLYFSKYVLYHRLPIIRNNTICNGSTFTTYVYGLYYLLTLIV